MTSYFPPTLHNKTVNTLFNPGDFSNKLGGSLSQSTADSRYLQQSGGTIKNLVSSNGITTQYTTGYADGQIGYVLSGTPGTTTLTVNISAAVSTITLASKGVYVISGLVTPSTVPASCTLYLCISTSTSGSSPYSNMFTNLGTTYTQSIFSTSTSCIVTNATGTLPIYLVALANSAVTFGTVQFTAVRIA